MTTLLSDILNYEAPISRAIAVQVAETVPMLGAMILGSIAATKQKAASIARSAIIFIAALFAFAPNAPHIIRAIAITVFFGQALILGIEKEANLALGIGISASLAAALGMITLTVEKVSIVIAIALGAVIKEENQKQEENFKKMLNRYRTL